MAVSDALSRSFRDVDIQISVGNGRLMAYLARHGEILSRQYSGEQVTIHCRLPEKCLGRIAGDAVIVRAHNECFEASAGSGSSAPSPADAETRAVEDVA